MDGWMDGWFAFLPNRRRRRRRRHHRLTMRLTSASPASLRTSAWPPSRQNSCIMTTPAARLARPPSSSSSTCDVDHPIAVSALEFTVFFLFSPLFSCPWYLALSPMLLCQRCPPLLAPGESGQQLRGAAGDSRIRALDELDQVVHGGGVQRLLFLLLIVGRRHGELGKSLKTGEK